jgi:phytoene dehydrogenase-like protein
MSDYDAIVIGAGHNGLTAAAILQRGGMRTLVLEKNKYAGGMASTVELFDGYHYEIAGSVLFPPAPDIVADLGLDVLRTVDTAVMSVNLGGPDDEPMIFYRDAEALMMHLADKHGADAMMGMAELLGWAEAPARALGRFDVRTPPRTVDEMYACARNETERAAIGDMLFGSVMDVLNRFFPDKEKARVMRGMLAFLAVNSTYRGPYTPGSATCLAFALAAPPGTEMMQKLEGGIGSLTGHVRQLFESHGGELRLKAIVERILVDGDRVTGVELKGGEVVTAPIVISNLDPGVTFTQLLDSSTLPADLVARVARVDHRAAYIQMHFAMEGLPEYVAPYEFLNDPELQGSIGMFGSPEEMQLDWENCRRGIVPENPSMGLQIPSVHDPALAPAGKHAASAFAMYFPVENDRAIHGKLKAEMGERVMDKLSRLAPNFRDLVTRHTTFASYHMETMFGCPAGDFCHGLIHPELMGANRPGPRGWRDMPVPLDGLYLGGAGCAGGPGITFIPGYNAGYEALEDASKLAATV